MVNNSANASVAYSWVVFKKSFYFRDFKKIFLLLGKLRVNDVTYYNKLHRGILQHIINTYFIRA